MKTPPRDKHPPDDRIIAEGPKWIAQSEYRRVRDTVHLRYAERLAAARWWQRLWLRLRIRREIDRELRRLAPREGLYRHRELR